MAITGKPLAATAGARTFHRGGNAVDAAIAANEAQAGAFWRLRESISEAERAHGFAIKHDVSVPISQIPRLMDEARAAAQALVPAAEIIAFGHVGDGNIHFNVAKPPGMTDEAFLAFRGRAPSPEPLLRQTGIEV